MNFNFYKKYVSGLIILTIFLNLTGVILIFPKKAEALVSVQDIGAYFREALAQTTRTATWGQTIISAYNAVQNTIHNRLIEMKEYVLDGLAWTMANVIIDKFADSLVTWIQSGFQGSPMFLSDPEGFFKDTANAVSGAVINDLNMNWLCDPLGKLRIDIDFFFPGTSKSKYACTFEDISESFKSMARRDISGWIDVNVNINQQNIVRRFGDDFRNGGFLMWLATADPKNNSIGRYQTARDDIYNRAHENVEKEKFGLSINGGFFGLRKCVEWATEPRKENLDSKGNAKCLKSIDTTPGQLVQDQLNEAAGGSFKRLQVADEINEIIGALATTMVGWLLTGGNDSGGVLGYDKNAGYSGSNRDHFGALKDSQTIIKKKTDISSQIVIIKDGEERYNNSLEDYADALYGAKEKLEIVLAKLKCIRATSTNDTSNTYDDSDCDGADEDIKNISLSAMDKTTDDISSDISKTESEISDIDGKISSFTGKYGENATSTSARTLELFDEFENKIAEAVSPEEIETTKEGYCYFYEETDKTGKICGLFGATASKEKETYKTHNEKEVKEISKEASETEIKMKMTVLEYTCLLNSYTKTENVGQRECAIF